ncbi:MAG: ATP-binding cassette domain-containing protein [Candidatus Dormibacteria bacterium]
MSDGPWDSTRPAVSTKALRKSFQVGKSKVEAVSGIDLTVPSGEIYGFLGPNGAGKTTTLRILTTLLPIDSGEAFVAGVDVKRKPKEVRRRIGYVGQLGGSDLPATGRENLVLQGRLYGASPAQASGRASELIESFELSGFADRVARTYSGGQRRRLEVALGIMHQPEVLFLDEPTIGLDPQNRAKLWVHLRSLRASGTTIFLTTHYLEEADALADRLAIIDHGQLVAEGSPLELKRRFAGEVVSVTPKPGRVSLEDLRQELERQPYVSEARVEGRFIRLYVIDGAQALPLVLDRLRSDGVALDSITVSEPSLDDVFLQQTGRSLRDASDPSSSAVVAA